ncbi:MAG TPA: hypothetical protein VFQ05_14660 [Candidatus Eisenbacteria bacterium]|nr:hypothetical protein [Candidatus Eisenbacteria bacterium]
MTPHRSIAGLMVMALGLGGVAILGVSAQSTPPTWTPPALRSPLRQIWSFDTKG